MTSAVRGVLGATVIAYVVVMFGVSLWARRNITSEEDYLVAGRRLPLWLAWPSLFATWFGAGTLLTAAQEIREGGLPAAALEPFGAGFCLVLAGLFFAKPLWEMKLLTLSDFYRRRFGPRAELVSAVIMVPGYFGWIAAQFVALAGVLELFFGLDPTVGILLVAVVGTGYTLIGGMWSVTLTDALQVALVLTGLGALGYSVAAHLGDGAPLAGLAKVLEQTPPEKLELVPMESLAVFVPWLAAFSAGALGNLPGQDLTQRIFASNSSKTARRACVVAGLMYLTMGLVPVFLALSVDVLGVSPTKSILPALAELFLEPAIAVVFVVAVMSAVLSTITSAILSPAGVLAQNILPRVSSQPSLRLNQMSVFAVALASLAIAYVGESAYDLLESAYELGVAGLLVPLVMGVYNQRGGERAAVASMISGIAVWAVHLALGWENILEPLTEPLGFGFPIGLSSAGLGLVAYFVTARTRAG